MPKVLNGMVAFSYCNSLLWKRYFCFIKQHSLIFQWQPLYLPWNSSFRSNLHNYNIYLFLSLYITCIREWMNTNNSNKFLFFSFLELQNYQLQVRWFMLRWEWLKPGKNQLWNPYLILDKPQTVLYQDVLWILVLLDLLSPNIGVCLNPKIPHLR